MKKLYILLFALIPFVLRAQTNFEQYDNAHSFKGIKFGSSVASVASKMRIKEQSYKNYYTILDKSYLNWGNLFFTEGAAYFSKGSLASVMLTIENNAYKSFYDDIYNELTRIFGEYHKSQYINGFETKFWNGNNISIRLAKVENASKPFTTVVIMSTVYYKDEAINNM